MGETLEAAGNVIEKKELDVLRSLSDAELMKRPPAELLDWSARLDVMADAALTSDDVKDIRTLRSRVEAAFQLRVENPGVYDEEEKDEEDERVEAEKN